MVLKRCNKSKVYYVQGGPVSPGVKFGDSDGVTIPVTRVSYVMGGRLYLIL